MTATFWSDTPKNRYASQRMGMPMPPADTRDAFSARRRTTALLAAIFLAVNVAVLAALAPAVLDTIEATLTLPDLGIPQR